MAHVLTGSKLLRLALAVVIVVWMLAGTAAFAVTPPCTGDSNSTYPCSIGGTLLVASTPSGKLFTGGGGGGGGGGGKSTITIIEDPRNPGFQETVSPPLQGSGIGPFSLSGTLNLATVSGQATITGGNVSINCGVTGTASLSLSVSTPGGPVVVNCPTVASVGAAMTVTGEIGFAAASTAVIAITLSGNATTANDSVTLNGFSLQLQIPSASPGTPYYFSDLAFGGGLQSTLTYVNYSPQAVTCETTFYADPGAPLPIPFSQGTVSSRTDTLQPGQSIHDQTVASLTAPVMEGWAQASCTGPVQASVLYRLYQAGVPVGEASVNAETAATTKFVTFAQTATGVAYANPSPAQSAMVTIAVYNAAGAKLGSHVITLGPLAHGSENPGPVLGLGSFTGWVKITSTIPIISLSLNAEAFPVFSSLPAGDLPGSTPLVP